MYIAYWYIIIKTGSLLTPICLHLDLMFGNFVQLSENHSCMNTDLIIHRLGVQQDRVLGTGRVIYLVNSLNPLKKNTDFRYKLLLVAM